MGLKKSELLRKGVFSHTSVFTNSLYTVRTRSFMKKLYGEKSIKEHLVRN